jgi:hypothetical protein
MTTAQKILSALVVLVLVILGVGAFLSFNRGVPAGASINRYEAGVWQFGNGIYAGLTQQFAIDKNGALTTSGTVTLGASGSAINQVLFTTCTLTVYGTSLAATSSARFDCPVTGLTTAAKAVFISLASTTQTGAGNGSFMVFGTGASTTAGYATGFIYNLSGAATSSYAQATSSAQVFVIQ